MDPTTRRSGDGWPRPRTRCAPVSGHGRPAPASFVEQTTFPAGSVGWMKQKYLEPPVHVLGSTSGENPLCLLKALRSIASNWGLEHPAQCVKSLREQKQEAWKEYLSAYLGKPLSALPSSDTIIVNKEFSFVEQKRAQLAFQQPEVQTKAKRPPRAAGPPDGQRHHQELGMDGANVKTMLDEATADTLIFGLGQPRSAIPPRWDPRSPSPIPDPMTGSRWRIR